MPRRCLWFVVLLSGVCGLLSCTPLPPQPSVVQPYARIVLPGAIHLLGVDEQTFAWQMRVQDIRVAPGPHRLRMTYEGSSLVRASRTWSFSWRPKRAISTALSKTCRVFGAQPLPSTR
jgi:hypothetical protein